MAKGSNKNKRSRIGFPKNLTIKTNNSNTFTVYGDSIGDLNSATSVPPVVKHVFVTGKHHDWGPATFVDAGNHALKITANCPKRHSNPDDDLTVTIVLDPNTPNEDITTITFPDVDYDDAP